VRQAQLYAWRAEELGISVTWPLVVQVDNQQAKTFQRGTCVQSRVRGCVDLREAWVQELRDKKKIKVEHVKGCENPADILTKCLPNYKFRQGLKLLWGDQETRNVAMFLREMQQQ